MRKFFAKVHLWLSIPFGIIIAIVCLTGAILVFETEILELGYPSRYFVKEVKGDPLSPAALIESARQQLPDSVRINGIRVSSDPRRTYQLILPGKKAAGFIDPYTGEVTGMDDGQGFFLKMMRSENWAQVSIFLSAFPIFAEDRIRFGNLLGASPHDCPHISLSLSGNIHLKILGNGYDSNFVSGRSADRNHARPVR